MGFRDGSDGQVDLVGLAERPAVRSEEEGVGGGGTARLKDRSRIAEGWLDPEREGCCGREGLENLVEHSNGKRGIPPHALLHPVFALRIPRQVHKAA